MSWPTRPTRVAPVRRLNLVDGGKRARDLLLRAAALRAQSARLVEEAAELARTAKAAIASAHKLAEEIARRAAEAAARVALEQE